jgi:hypothetical protein
MIRPQLKTVLRLLSADVVKVLALAGFLLAVHAYLERRPSGRYLRQFQFALLEEDLKHGPFDDTDFEAGGEHLPLVIDISKLHPDKSKPTDRAELDRLISELEKTRPRAIGVDLDFAESDSDDLVGEDYRYLDKWRAYGNVRVGVFRRAMKKREAWLGLPEFGNLAAGIALPNDDPRHGFLYSRRLYNDCKVANGSTRCKEDLIQMPVAMWMLSERTGRVQEDALQELERRSTKSSPETGLP